MPVTLTCIFIALVAITFGGVILWAYIKPSIDAKKEEREEQEKLSKMNEKEKAEYFRQKMYGFAYRQALQNEAKGGLPTFCPKCHAYNFPLSKWVLQSSKAVEVEKLDKAYTLGGATTVFTKKERTQVKTYKCPKCDYTHTV